MTRRRPPPRASGAWCFGLVVLLAPALRAEVSPARFAAGAELFQQNCAVCHRPDGSGQPALAPPLTRYPARYLQVVAGRRQLAATVLYGLFGDVVVEERHYNFKMPDFPQLGDEAVAAVLNFVAFDLAMASADTAPLTAPEVAAARAEPKSGAQVRATRAALLSSLEL
jgi:mono/diheme cytochrome c family protein